MLPTKKTRLFGKAYSEVTDCSATGAGSATSFGDTAGEERVVYGDASTRMLVTTLPLAGPTGDGGLDPVFTTRLESLKFDRERSVA